MRVDLGPWRWFSTMGFSSCGESIFGRAMGFSVKMMGEEWEVLLLDTTLAMVD
jgi:hypothetical protein